MHVPLKSQEDFIAAVVETRKNSDILKDKLKKNDYQKINLELDKGALQSGHFSLRFFPI